MDVYVVVEYRGRVFVSHLPVGGLSGRDFPHRLRQIA